MTQDQSSGRDMGGIVRSAWAVMTKLLSKDLGHNSLSWTSLVASCDLPTCAPSLIFSSRIPAPISDEEIARMVAVWPRVRPAQPIDATSAGASPATSVSAPNIAYLQTRASAAETESALTEALARLRQLTKRGGH